MILEFEFNPSLPQCVLCGVEVGSINAESEMVNGEANWQRNIRIIGWEKRDRHLANSNNTRKISPNVFIETIKSE